MIVIRVNGGEVGLRKCLPGASSMVKKNEQPRNIYDL